jgi:hypothetical protein
LETKTEDLFGGRVRKNFNQNWNQISGDLRRGCAVEFGADILEEKSGAMEFNEVIVKWEIAFVDGGNAIGESGDSVDVGFGKVTVVIAIEFTKGSESGGWESPRGSFEHGWINGGLNIVSGNFL